MIWYLQTDTHWYRQLLIQIHRSRLERKTQSERALYLQSSLVSNIISNTWRRHLIISYLCLQWQYVCLHAHYLWRGGDVLSICRAAAPGSGPGQAPNRHRSTRVRAGARLLCLLLHTFSVFRVQSVTLFHTVCLELCKYCSGDKISTKIATEL